MIGDELEQVRTPTGPAFADAVTFAFGDAEAQVYGLARIGLSPASEGEGRQGSALAVLFAGREPVAAIARGGLEVPADAGWDAISLGGLSMTVGEPLRAWNVTMEGEQHGFELRFEALSPPAEIAGEDPLPQAGGMAGYEQLCGVTGVVRAGGEPIEVRCLGQRGHGWGEPDWERIEVARTVSAWPGAGPGVALSSVRPQRRRARGGAGLGRAARRRRHACASTTRACRRPTTPTAASAAPAWSCGCTATSTRCAARARCCAGRRSTSARCAWTARSSAGGSRARPASGRYDVLRRA